MLRALLAAVLLAIACVAPPVSAQRGPGAAAAADIGDIRIDQLPKEARETIGMIRRGPPFPYAKDGAVFGNREGMLPRAKRGYYREYTVKTPGVRTRGARRIVAGASGELYYSDDHYNHFRRVRE